jgi:hypothetical protein
MQEAERNKAEVEAAAKQVKMMNLGGYQPPQIYQERYKDPEFFAHAYQKYVDELA